MAADGPISQCIADRQDARRAEISVRSFAERSANATVVPRLQEAVRLRRNLSRGQFRRHCFERPGEDIVDFLRPDEIEARAYALRDVFEVATVARRQYHRANSGACRRNA